MEKLQDTVEPFEFKIVEKVIKQELGAKISDIYEDFDPTPIAAASIGQVHRAKLKKDRLEVVVKVQRPQAQEIIESDLDLLFTLVELVKQRVKFVDLVGVAQEFSDSLHRELDYRVEGRHVDKFRHNFQGDPIIKIPLVFWDCSSKRILTLEYIEGTRLSDLAASETQGIDTYRLAKYGAQAFMRQVLEQGFFHGDLHPANILITPDAKIAYLDFGIVGQITEEDKETIAFLLMAIIKQDISEIVSRSQDLGVEIPQEKIPVVKKEFREILDRYYGRKLKELKIDIIGREFLNLIYKYHLRIPKDYALLVKALITVEGAAKVLYPEFNMLEVARPYVYNLIRREYLGEKTLEDIYEQLKACAAYAFELPKQVHEILSKARAGELEVRYRYTGLEKPAARFERATNRLSIALVFSAILLGMAAVVIFYPRVIFVILWAAFTFLSFLWLAFSIFRSR